MINNGTLHYDHDRDGTHTQLAGCEAKFRNLEHDTYVVVRYENDKLSGKQINRCLSTNAIKLISLFQCLRTLITKLAGSHA